MIDYRDGKARQCLGTIYMGSMEGDFSKAVDFLKKEFKEYTNNYVKKAGVVYGVFADSDLTKFSRYGYSGNDQRTYKFDRIYLRWEMVYDYDDPNGKRELQVWGDREVSEAEQIALGLTQKVAQEQQEQRERAEFERLKARFEKQEN